ncbi:MAG: CoA transferase subunit A [Chitinophagales bacterium]
MSSKFNYNEEAVNNLRIEDTSVLDNLINAKSAREYHLKKNRSKVDKRMTLKEAVARFVEDGDCYADTGFGYVRTPLQVHWEVMRQRKKNLQYIGSPNTNQSYVEYTGCGRYSHNSYTGAEMRGIDRIYGQLIKDKKVQVLSEWGHGSMGLGFKAAQFGAPFIASKQLLGSEMLKYNPYVKVENNPFQKDKDPVCMIPALYPDVTFIHCQQADMYGNGKIYGPPVNDIALAFASRKVVITCEEVVPEMEMRFNTKDNAIPFMLVDAVVELPYGCLPGSCPGYYYWSREWWEWGLRIAFANKKKECADDFLNYWVFDCQDQYQFVDKLNSHFGGMRYIDNLRRVTKAEELANEESGVDFNYPQVIPVWE